MTIMITVTAAHIAKGTPGEACECPVFFAICDALPQLGPEDIAVGPDDVGIAVGDGWSVPLQPVAVHWIAGYDSTGRGKPFTFGLDVPDALLAAAGTMEETAAQIRSVL